MSHKNIVLKTKSIVMRTTNNVFRKVHNCTHFKRWSAQFERKCNILKIFHYFQYFERFRSMKKWQMSKLKIVDWYLDFSKESYTTLKSVISSFKICFQNYGQLKRKFLRPKNTSSTVCCPVSGRYQYPDTWNKYSIFEAPFSVFGKRSISNESWTFQL